MTTPEKAWEIPELLSVREVRIHDGAVIILWRHGNQAGPGLVLPRGNGLASCFQFSVQTRSVCRRSVAP